MTELSPIGMSGMLMDEAIAHAKHNDELVSIIAHGIADAQGDAYAEYSSEFDGYARAALDALKKNLAGLSTNGLNVWGHPADIATVMAWQHSHATIEDVRALKRVPMTREIGWIVELRGPSPQWWYLRDDGEDGEGWTADSLEALRFARKQDAVAYIDSIGWTEAFATEHEWVDAMSSREEATKE